MKPWELGDDSVFQEPSREKIKEHKQKEFNKKQKSLVKLVGENLASYALVLIVVLMIGFIWTDLGISLTWTSFLIDSLMSVVLFIVAESLTAKIGTSGGRLDDIYIMVHNEYVELRKTVFDAGITLMDKFCEWQIDVEYEFFLRKKCKEHKINYDKYVDTYSRMTLPDLQKELGKQDALIVAALNKTSRIELTPDMLLTDGKVRGERGGIPISGEEYVEKHTTGFGHIALAIITAILTAFPAFALTEDVSLGRVIYTVFKLAMLIYRMYNGYSRGAKAFNTIAPRNLRSKIRYLNLYLEFLRRNGEDYGTEGSKSEQTDPQGRREGEGGGVLHDRPAESVRASASG
jgi:hypothetical protein